MKITNEALDVATDILSNLHEQTGKLGFVIAYNKSKIIDAARTYHDFKIKLLRKYGTEDKGTGVLHINEDESPEKYEAFKKEMGDTPNIEIDVEILKLAPEELYSGTLTTSEMANLLWMVDCPEKEEKKNVEGDKKA